jgi:hypothetical protein
LRLLLAGWGALLFAMSPAEAAADEAGPLLSLMAARCNHAAGPPPMPEGWRAIPAEEAEPLIAGIAAFEARIAPVLAGPLSEEPHDALVALLTQRMGLWLSETGADRIQARLWRREGDPSAGDPVLTLLRAAQDGPIVQLVQCALLVEGMDEALADALARRFEILHEQQGMAVRVWSGSSEVTLPDRRESHTRQLAIQPGVTPDVAPSALLQYTLTGMAQ